MKAVASLNVRGVKKVLAVLRQHEQELKRYLEDTE